jgi:N-acetylmuramoyl-L-alanine amidase
LDANAPKYYNKETGLNVIVSRDSFANNYKSRILASTVINSFTSNYDLAIAPNPQQRKAGIKVLEANTFPSVIIEAGYITNDKDLQYLKSEKGQTAFANNVLRAIGNYAANNNIVSLKAINDTPPNGTVTISSVQSSKENDELLKHPRITEITTDLDYPKTEGLYIINGKIYSKEELNNKKITGGKATYYKKGTAALIEKYGPKAENGIVIFENAKISNLEKKTTINDFKNALTVNMDSIYFVDASQRKKQVSPLPNLNKTNFISSKDEPLYIIDGVRKEKKDFNNFSAENISTIKILKTKEATEKYGINAMGGAIEVTTKSFESKMVDPVFRVGNFTNHRISSSDFKDAKFASITDNYELVEASVYFSGTNFEKVQTSKLTGTNLAQLNNFIQKCAPGTSVTFDNIKVKNKLGIRVIDGASYILY